MSVLTNVKEATISGNAEEVSSLVKRALEEGWDPETIIQDGFITAMTVVGEKFKNNEIFVPEMLVAARAMQFGMEELEPCLVSGERKHLARIVLGTVKGDLHDIGKNLLGIMLQGNGAEIIDLGVDVSCEDFVKAVKEHRPQFLGLSSLLTTTMPALKEVIEAIKIENLHEHLKILVGGAPVSSRYADEIGADGYAENAVLAVELVKKMMGTN